MNVDKTLLALKNLENDLDSDSVLELVQDFLQEAPSSLQELHRLMGLGPSAELTRAAHSLKGCCSIYQADDLVQLCQKFESASAKGDAEALSPIMQTLENGLHSLLEVLKQYAAENAQ